MQTPLLAIPNFSQARETAVIDQLTLTVAEQAAVRLLDTHTDLDHNRTVFTLAGRQGTLAELVARLAETVAAQSTIAFHDGVHPFIGTTDVAPIVYMDASARGGAAAEALTLASMIGDGLGIPVLLYGELTEHRITRADARRGGPLELQRRIDAGELRPDFGPIKLHPRAGAALVSSRPPLIAFNVELAPPATEADAKRIAALIREGGAEGLPGVRALGVTLRRSDGVAQVTTNIEAYWEASPADVVAAISRHADVIQAEVVGLPPKAAFAGFPLQLPVKHLRFLEDALSG